MNADPVTAALGELDSYLHSYHVDRAEHVFLLQNYWQQLQTLHQQQRGRELVGFYHRFRELREIPVVPASEMEEVVRKKTMIYARGNWDDD